MGLTEANNGLLTSAETGWPRVPQRVSEGIYIAYLPIIVVATITRLAVKFRNHGRLETDDGFLVFAMCCSITAWACVWQMRDLVYLQMEMVLGMKVIELEDLNSMLVYFKWYNISGVLNWTAVYSVKICFMFFFRKLISRVRILEIYWWVIMAILIPTAIFSAFFSFWICRDFTITYISNCPVSSMIYREEIYLYVTTALDIFTDLLIISLPIILLSKVNISFKRKIILGMALCLSIFMIVICIIRVTTCKLPSGVIDSTWLALWQCVETNTAILMVSLTAFRSMYRQGSSAGYATPARMTKRPLRPSLRAFSLSQNKHTIGGNESNEYCVLPEKPRRAVSFVSRGATKEEIDRQLIPSLDINSEPIQSASTSEGDLNAYHEYHWVARSRGTGKLEAQILRDEYEEDNGGA